MSTFLLQAQKAARDSGVVSGLNQPLTTANQTGLLGKIVYWTQDAWRQIQNTENAWRWMRGEFTGATIANTPRYTNASWNITNWAEWIGTREDLRDFPYSIYNPVLGLSDETALRQLDFEEWRQTFNRGTQYPQKPSVYAISPAGEFCLGPTPDAIYTVVGPYRQTVQELVNDGDIPAMPARFHDLISYRARLLLAEHDEAGFALETASGEDARLMADLRRDQLPVVVERGSSLA